MKTHEAHPPSSQECFTESESLSAPDAAKPSEGRYEITLAARRDLIARVQC